MHSNCEIVKTNFDLFARFTSVCIFLFFFNAIQAQYTNDSVFNADTISNIELHDVGAGKQIFLNTRSNEKSLTLFIFLSPECPVCQNYSGKLNDLNKQYAGQVTM